MQFALTFAMSGYGAATGSKAIDPILDWVRNHRTIVARMKNAINRNWGDPQRVPLRK